MPYKNPVLDKEDEFDLDALTLDNQPPKYEKPTPTIQI